MKTKLTLSVDKNVVQSARRQAKTEGTSISRLFSEFVAARKAQAETGAPAPVKSMIGSLKAYPVNDSKSAIQSNYADKHLN